MDHAVSLVQAYLHANGYFTVAEYPVLERLSGGGYKSATDIDLMGLRLPEAGGVLAARERRGRSGGPTDDETDLENAFEPDPALAVPGGFLERYLGENWDILRHAQIRHSALGFLALQEQIRRAREASRREDTG